MTRFAPIQSCLAGLLALALALAPALAGAQGLDLSLPDLGDPSSDVLPPSEEARIGQEMMREIRGEVDLITDPSINAYIRDLGARIAVASDMPATEFRFFVVDDPRINAFAMPGGYVGVHSGLITAARDESELGAVIAHELSHVTQRHIARRIAAYEQTSLRTAALVLAGLLIGSQNPQAGMAAATTGMASGIDSQLAYSRDHEREADRVGMRILSRAELDPMGMPEFFQVLLNDNRYRSQPPAFLSTHPLTQARIADARAMADELKPERVFESPDFAYVRARLAVLVADNPDQARNIFQARVQSEATPGDRYGLATALVRSGDPARATTIFEGLDEARGEHEMLYLGLAEAALAENRVDDALGRINAGLSLFPDSVGLQVTRIDALLREDRAQKALALTRNLTHEHPEAPGIWELHARVASAAADPAESALAMAHYYAVQGDLRAGLSQLRRVDPASASASQRSRANALRDRWESRLTPPG